MLNQVQVCQLRIARLWLRLDELFDKTLRFGSGPLKQVNKLHQQRCEPKKYLLETVNIPNGSNKQLPNRPIVTFLQGFFLLLTVGDG